MNTVWTNQRVALTHDFIFGVNVMTEDGWQPFSSLDLKDMEYVWKLIDHNPSCPWLPAMRNDIKEKKELATA